MQSVKSQFSLPFIAAKIRSISLFARVETDDLKIMAGKGLTHDHISLGETGWLLRIPRKNQLEMTPADYLVHQYNCYRIASGSGCAPSCLAVVEPQEGLAQGALIVQKIEGRKPVLPQDWPSIAVSLAKLHSTPRSAFESAVKIERQPFASQDFLLNVLFRPGYEQATLSPLTRKLMDAELFGINQFLRDQPADQNRMALLGGDSHPANFMIDEEGKAWLVDLEFMLADTPLIDLADAGLSITANLEPDIAPCRDEGLRHAFYKKWEDAVLPDLKCDTSRDMVMAERIVRMRTLLWLCDWSIKRQNDPDISKIPAATIQNWDAMASNYLNPAHCAAMFKSKLYPVPLKAGLSPL